MLDRATICWLLGLSLALIACDSDDASQSLDSAVDASSSVDAQSGNGAAGESAAGAGASGVSGSGGRAGAGGRRSPLACEARSNEPVHCGGQTCPTSAEFEDNPCFTACCVMFQGAERCGFRGTATAFSTECVLPAVADLTCDEIPQFQGCCEPTRHVCGIIGGFAPGCATKSNFVTLPASPKACGASDDDGGVDADAGAP